MTKVNLPPLPDNSKSGAGVNGNGRTKTEERHAKQVASGKVHNSIGKSLLRDFILEDPRDVAAEIWEQNVVPGVKEALRSGFECFLYGIGGTPRAKSKSSGGYGRVSYDQAYTGSSNRSSVSSNSSRDRSRVSRKATDLDDILFEDTDEGRAIDQAKDVLQSLFDEAVDYDRVAVAYYYELCGITEGVPYTAQDYGWTRDMLEGVHAERVRGGAYVLTLPKPVRIK